MKGFRGLGCRVPKMEVGKHSSYDQVLAFIPLKLLSGEGFGIGEHLFEVGSLIEIHSVKVRFKKCVTLGGDLWAYMGP